jgi:cardiolipin synthase
MKGRKSSKALQFIILVVATLALIGALLSFILTAKSHKLGSFIKVGQNPSSTPQSTNQPSSTQLNYISVCAEPTCTYSALDSAIANAQHSVEVIMYELSDQLIEQELIEDARHYVNVRVLLDYAYHGKYINQSTEAYLSANGVQVKFAPDNIIVHEKAVIVDNSKLFILSGNLTSKYYLNSADWLVTDSQPTDIQTALAAFNSDWQGNVGSEENGIIRDLLFSPGAMNFYLSLINSAKSSIFISSEEMTSSDVISALESAAHRKVKITLLMTSSNLDPDTLKQLQAANITCDLVNPHSLYIHAKTLIVDDSIAVIGSQNDSTSSLAYNRELSIELSSPSLVHEVTMAFNKWLQLS